MIATWRLKIAKPGLALDLTRSFTIAGDSYKEGIGLAIRACTKRASSFTHLSSHEVRTHESVRMSEALGSLRISIDDILSRRDVAMKASIRGAETLPHVRPDQGWVRSLEEAIRNGLTAEGRPSRRCRAPTKARLFALPILTSRPDQ